MATVTRVRFDNSRKDDIGLVREVLLRRLREDGSAWTQFRSLDHEFERFLEFPSNNEKGQFDDLLREIIWEFVVTGIITPGNGLSTSQAGLPHFSITEFGRKVLAEERAIPHDPDGYLAEIRTAGEHCVDVVAVGYVEEALSCFTRGCYTASVLLLGVAAEAVVLKACDLIKPAAEKEYNIKTRHRRLVDRYRALSKKERHEALPDGLDVTLTSAYDLIRRQRNDLGHPQVPPTIDRQHAFTFFQVFLTVVRDLEAFATYIRHVEKRNP